MATKRREAQRAAREARQAALLAQQRAAKRRRQIISGLVAFALVAGVFLAFSGGRSKGKKETTTGSSTTVASSTTKASSTTAAPVDVPKAPAGKTLSGDTPCPPPDGSADRVRTFAKAPPMCIDAAKRYVAEMTTNKGLVTIALDPKAAPKTVNSFVVLSRYHYYDGVSFHRIIPGFVVQGGDPEATGSGGPGYKFDDELPAAGKYKVGSLAMANSGPNTNGSQFFIITGDQGVQLPPNYSLFGEVTSGLDVVRKLEAAGTADGKPTEVVTIQSVTIKES